MPHLFLYGPPGTGKSTVGKILAANLNLAFVDLDRLIETKAGLSIPEIMDRKGEAAFRELEAETLSTLMGWSDAVIALGGGALLRESNRRTAESNGSVVLLTAKFETLLERVKRAPEKRPLLAGDAEKKLSALLAQRGAHYASFPLQLCVDEKSAEQNARDAQILLGRFHLSAMSAYEVRVETVEQIANLFRALDLQNPIIVTDENVAPHHAGSVVNSLTQAGFNTPLVILPAGEAHKNLETVNQLWHRFLEAGLDRKTTVIALGGGVVSDLAGFAASTYMRGVNWIALPTTLLAMADAALGGKTGFDLPEGKNLIGSFHAPRLVLADPQTLATLPERELRAGMAEVVKHGVIADPNLFEMCKRGMDWVRQNLEVVVKRAMAVKIQVIEDDPYERGFRAALNAGHTVGHAVELVSRFELMHGEAIAIGLVAETRYAERIGLASAGLADQIAATLSALGLPTEIPPEFSREDILRAMRVDKKKSAQSIRFALPTQIGHVELEYVTELEKVIISTA
ncbi:MAG: 3-dehydroquinate synthase [Anaerolineales bacterium]|nr:3-dehydroquinate synthase [Anaerolineales bacterium]